MRKIKITGILLLCISVLNGQTPVGSWTDHLVYTTATSLAVSSTQIYASTGSAIIIFNKEFEELKKLSRVSGLSESGIAEIAWSEDNDALIIGYSSTNIDIIKSNKISNIPDIELKYIPGKKEINKIRVNGRYAFLACSFGIVVLDLIKEEISDTWKPGTDSKTPEIWDITFGNGMVYAATSAGIYTASLTNPGLSYFDNWSLLNSLPTPAGNYNGVLFAGNKLYVNRSGLNFTGDSVYVADNGVSLFSYTPAVFITSFDKSDNGFTISSSKSVRYFDENGNIQKNITSFGSINPDVAQAIEDDGNIWIADKSSGLIKVSGTGDFMPMSLPGPVSNNSIFVTSQNGKTIICGGGVNNAWNTLGRTMQVSIHESASWTHLAPGVIKDPMRALIDPKDNDHIFISTWGWGLLEYDNNVLKNRYTEANSPLQTIIAGAPYVRLCGMAMDKDGNLWVTQSEVPGTLKILKPDGNWIVNPFTVQPQTAGDLIITGNGHKWVVLPRGYGLYILDDNGTPEYSGDDRTKSTFVEDSEGNIIPFVYSIAEDLEGNIWVGTDQGPLVYYNPEKIFDGNLKAFRIKVPRNDGSGAADHLLKTETINSIAIDGANRKWLGTFSSGAFLVSPDGTRRIKSVNESNSPLLSNTIASIAVDDKTGDVWFATSKGTISVRGDATSGKEIFDGVYAFPNPVREDFFGNVTITGLIRDTQVNITDISGNLVYKTVSDGGQASWDLTTYNGERVATGVYLAFCASGDGTKSCVIKILVIK